MGTRPRSCATEVWEERLTNALLDLWSSAADVTEEETVLTRDELFSEILVARPCAEDLVYIERRGEDYAWNHIRFGTYMPDTCSDSNTLPDVWIYYSGRWPSKDEHPDRWREFFDDLLAEMESMAGGNDRCRWSLDDPWPYGH